MGLHSLLDFSLALLFAGQGRFWMSTVSPSLKPEAKASSAPAAPKPPGNPPPKPAASGTAPQGHLIVITSHFPCFN